MPGSESAPARVLQDGDVLDLLTSLSDKNLVLAEQTDGHSRYRLLETVRQYAREKLVESGVGEAVREPASGLLPGAGGGGGAETVGCGASQTGCSRLEAEHDNLRAALDWSLVEARIGGRVFGFAGRCNGSGWTRGHLPEGGSGVCGS